MFRIKVLRWRHDGHEPASVLAISSSSRARTRGGVHLRRISAYHMPDADLWAAGGPLDTFYEQYGGALGIWRKWADNAQGQAMKGGHFFPEENPTEAAEILHNFPFA
jgi:hypothetical protein